MFPEAPGFKPWNRLVEVRNGAAVVATCEYDGLHRRIVKTAGASTEHYYYNEAWQCVEMRTGTETGLAKGPYVWHPQYIDALALRCWDNDGNGDYAGTNELHYAVHDGNFNVTALLSTANAVIDRFAYSPYGTFSTSSPQCCIGQAS